MNTRVKNRFIRPLVLALAAATAISPAGFTPVATAQSYSFAQEQPAFSQQELDQMLAPIALYPDSLLSQILMASTYPLEVVQAARWSRANPHLRGDEAVRAVASQDWDPSVKSLVAFPQILDMMDQKLDWTERLGDAFMAQQPQLMDTVQQLRQRAYAAGNLRSDDRIRVTPQERVIVVEPAQPHVVYVPYYNPVVVYGPWWWPHHPPVFWSPWPGYHPRSGLSVSFFWGSGITLSSGFFFGGFDWHRRHARIVHVHNHYYHRHHDVSRVRTVNVAPGQWRHDPDHRRGVPYRSASVRQQFGGSNASRDDRRDNRGRESSAIIRSQDERRDGRDARVQSNDDRRSDRRDRDDDRSNARDARSPAAGAAVNATARPAQERNDNRPETRSSVSRPEAAVTVRPEARERERNDNRPDARDARSPAPQISAQPTVRAQENTGRTDSRAVRGSSPRVEEKNDRRPDVRQGNDNRSDGRIDRRSELRSGADNRAEVRDNRSNNDNRSAAFERSRSAPPPAVQSAVVRSNPAPQANAERGNRRESRQAEERSRSQSSGRNGRDKS